MATTRRTFLQGGAAAMAMMMMPQTKHRHAAPPTRPVLDPSTLAQFVDPLPVPEIAKSLELRPSPEDAKSKIPYYKLAMRQTQAKVHRDLKPTNVWTLGGSLPGPTLEAHSGEAMLVEWANDLPARHLFAIDHNIHGAEADKPDVRAVMHMHGSRVPADSDGYPEKWYVPGKSATYYYPNHQDAAMLWYHDHTLGINRLNVYAGMFGLFILRDPVEDALNLPSGKYEIPLALCDRLFDMDGQLYYPISPVPGQPWVPEVFGNAILANGKLFPYLDVEPRKYRFRVLNAANGRFFHLSLSSGQNFQQIGTDQGLLSAPVPSKFVSLAPGERADMIIDFSDLAGEQVVLKNDVSLPVMQFRVSRSKVSDTSSLPAALRPLPKIPESQATTTRTLALAEIEDMRGDSVTMLLNNAHWNMPITERPALNKTEIWSLINTTDDTHPIHLHLVKFQILDRQRFDSFAYLNQNGVMRFRGNPVPPDASEAGWKDTVRADPGMITRIIVPFEGYAGRYVWHCHILEHEDNEMMRPFEVVEG